MTGGPTLAQRGKVVCVTEPTRDKPELVVQDQQVRLAVAHQSRAVPANGDHSVRAHTLTDENRAAADHRGRVARSVSNALQPRERRFGRSSV